MEKRLVKSQQEALFLANNTSLFLEGPPGSGKTTVATAFLQNLVLQGDPADTILILLPQRTLGQPYYKTIDSAAFPAGSLPQVMTIGGLARRMVMLYWPLISQNAGFQQPHLPPIFLNYEAAQYYAARLIEPLISDGFFDSVTQDNNRICSQILECLNKSAVTGIPISSIGERLKNAWVGKPEQLRVYDEVQICATKFREYCLENNMLDYSLLIETFVQHLWASFIFKYHFFRQFRHLIYDNIEEDVPIVHDLVQQWLPQLENSLLIHDSGGGYRVLLGADPQSAIRLKETCDKHFVLEESFIQSKPVNYLQDKLSLNILGKGYVAARDGLQSSLRVQTQKYFPEMVEWVCKEVHSLIHNEGVLPADICIISPYLSDALRFEFSIRFDELSVPFTTHRPSRGLKEEPATGCLLTLVKLLHPEWGITPSSFEFRSMLMQAITGFDLIRADLLTKIVYRSTSSNEAMIGFNDLQISAQDRISFMIGERYDQLRQVIEEYRVGEKPPLDILLSILFSEILSHPGFGFHTNLDAASTTSRLIESFINFDKVFSASENGQTDSSKTFVEMIHRGVFAGQYLETEAVADQAVFLSPAHTFLMTNHAVDYQFWLDVGSHGWWQRLNQPLTQPYVLSRNWDPSEQWTDAREYESNQSAMHRLTNGLLYRCRKQVTACIAEIDEQGMEQLGPLLKSIQSLLRSAAQNPQTQQEG